MSKLAVALDIGGTRIKAGVVEVSTGRVVARRQPEPTGASWADARARAETIIEDLRAAHPDAGSVGVAVPGVVDDGVVTRLPDKLEGLEGTDVHGWAAHRASGFVAVCNDAVAAGVGEATNGAGAEFLRVLTITLGTGVGVAIIDSGRVRGTGPYAGGILGGRLPLAGSSETIEDRCRARALVDRSRERGASHRSVSEVLSAAASGEEAAAAAVTTYRVDLVRALNILAVAHTPDIVVVAGGPANHPELLEGVQEQLNRGLPFGLSVTVAAAALGDLAALVGLGVRLGADDSSR